MPTALYVCSPDGAVLRFNRQAVALWGRSPQSRPQATFGGALRLYRLDGRPLALRDGPMGVALRTGEPQRDNEVVIERPDGSRIIVLVNVELLRSPGGELEGAIASFQDITGRKRIEEALAAFARTEIDVRHLFDRIDDPILVEARPNARWSLDFVHDQLANGRRL